MENRANHFRSSSEEVRRFFLLVACPVFAVALVVLGAGLLRSLKPVSEVTVAPLLRVASEHLDFGRVWARRDFAWTLPITNTSESEIAVDLVTSCNCTKVSPSSFALGAHETQDVRLILDLIPQNPLSDGDSPFHVTLLATVNRGRLADMNFTLRGSIRPSLAVVPSVLRFSDEWTTGESPAPQQLTVRSHGGCDNLIATCDPALATVNVSSDDSRKGQFVVTVAPSPQLPVGKHTFALTLQEVGTATAAPAMEVPVHVSVVGDLQFSPRLSHLGAIEVGSSVERVVLLASRSGKAFRVYDIVSDTAALSVEQVSAPDEGSRSIEGTLFRILCRPTESGAQTGVLEFKDPVRSKGRFFAFCVGPLNPGHKRVSSNSWSHLPIRNRIDPTVAA